MIHDAKCRVMFLDVKKSPKMKRKLSGYSNHDLVIYYKAKSPL